MKKSVLAIMVGALCIILSSCQETPEESSVVSKVDGISEAAVCEPLKKGEKRETNVPTHWKFEEKKSNDRVVIQADIKLGEQSIGNLPVIEMQNHELTQEELNGLIDYFTDGEELYMPQMVTKDAYQEVLDRISSKEGSYLQSAYSTSIAGIQNATREGMELAPDEASAPEKMEIKFQKKTEDHGVEAARSWMSTELENTDTEDYFTADVGEDRKAYIEAERYNQEIDNDSSFLWMEGSNFIEEETIETEEQEHFVSLVTFNSGAIRTIYDKVAVSMIGLLDEQTYSPNCCTPLYDAMGISLSALKYSVGKKDIALVTIITDGEENSSSEFTGQGVKTLVEELKGKGWVFTYIGTNQDVEKVAATISVTNVMSFDYSEQGTRQMFKKESRARSRFFDRIARRFSALAENYFEEKDDDINK